MKIDGGLMTTDLRDAAGLAAPAGRLGYAGLWTAEAGHAPYLPAALAATATERITIGTNIAVAFPRTPLVHAQVAWDLQAASRGRFVLGLGTQVKGHNERRYSTPWLAPGPRLREMILLIRHIWDVWQHGGPQARAGGAGEHRLRHRRQELRRDRARQGAGAPADLLLRFDPHLHRRPRGPRLGRDLSSAEREGGQGRLGRHGLAHHRRDARGLRGRGHVRRGPRTAQEEVRRGDRPARVLRGGPASGGRRPLAAAHRGVPLIARAEAASAVTRAARAARRSPGSAPRRDRPPRAPA